MGTRATSLALALIVASSAPSSAVARATNQNATKCSPGLLKDVVAALTGRFDTGKQFGRAPARLKETPSVGGKWLDRQHATMTRIDAEDHGTHVLFVEWRTAGPEGPVSRQRVWAFGQDQQCNVAMRFYSFKRPVSPGRLPDTLVATDLIAYPEPCAMHWRRKGRSWVGRIDPAVCRIVAQSGRAMRLDVTITANKRGFDYQEAGILASGAYAFAVPPTEPYRFDRVD